MQPRAPGRRRAWISPALAGQWLGQADTLAMPTLAALPPKADRWGGRGLLRNAWTNITYAPATGA
ncbi:hypothetical protein GCM10009734_50790 [Nonomuraea bangladeshensis]